MHDNDEGREGRGGKGSGSTCCIVPATHTHSTLVTAAISGYVNL